MEDRSKQNSDRDVVAVSGKEGMYVKKGTSRAGKKVSSFCKIMEALRRPLPSLHNGHSNGDRKNGTVRNGS